MKKIVALFAFVMTLLSCENDVKTNTPAFQGKLNNVSWRASQSFGESLVGGGVSIKGFGENDLVTLTLASKNVGTYIMGTSNSSNKASYTLNGIGANFYDTSVILGAVNKIDVITSGGSGYTNSNGLNTTTTGAGYGMKVAVTTTNGVVTKINLVSRGADYKAGDIVTIVGGNNNASFRILNVLKSNGEVTIEDNSNNKLTGSFKFNAIDDHGNVVTLSEGYFYQVPVQ